MTPLGHLSVSYVLGRSSKEFVLPALILGGAFPDVDFILLPFAWFNQVHRVVTHNLVFVSLLAFLLALFWRAQADKRQVFWSALLGGVLHLFVDSCLDGNASNGIGIALFWPFSGEFFSPLNLLSPKGDDAGWSEPLAFLRSSLRDFIPELPFWGLAVLLIIKERVVKIKQHTLEERKEFT